MKPVYSVTEVFKKEGIILSESKLSLNFALCPLCTVII